MDKFPFEVSASIESKVSEDGVEPVDSSEVTPSHSYLDCELQLGMTGIVDQRLLSGLLSFIDQRDDVEDAIRPPVTVGIVNIV